MLNIIIINTKLTHSCIDEIDKHDVYESEINECDVDKYDNNKYGIQTKVNKSAIKQTILNKMNHHLTQQERIIAD